MSSTSAKIIVNFWLTKLSGQFRVKNARKGDGGKREKGTVRKGDGGKFSLLRKRDGPQYLEGPSLFLKSENFPPSPFLVVEFYSFIECCT